MKHLINGSTIAQVPVERVTYYHIELAQHDVVLAEGLPAESFLDMKDGSNYANRPGPVRLYPDFTARMWEAFGCARLIVTGPELDGGAGAGGALRDGSGRRLIRLPVTRVRRARNRDRRWCGLVPLPGARYRQHPIRGSYPGTFETVQCPGIMQPIRTSRRRCASHHRHN